MASDIVLVTSTAEDRLLKEVKPLIQQGKIKELQERWKLYSDPNTNKTIKWTSVFQKTILYAANRKQAAIFDWIETLYDKFNEPDRKEVDRVYSYAYFVRHNVVEEGEEVD
uniref:Uncharacterized protein n=1 Tax=viral metagenome TaxID=1070528 RepID=A0A6C0KTI8_9ZZZZ